jgi:hypothetical protein
MYFVTHCLLRPISFLDDDVAQKGKGLMEHGDLEMPPSLNPQHPLGAVPDDRIAQLAQELVERDEVGAPSYPFVYL